MARKRREEEHENHERWLVSYADFITLLFAFFVVMYAVSSVNEGKYKVLSNSLNNAFSNKTGEPGGQPITVMPGALPIRVRGRSFMPSSAMRRGIWTGTSRLSVG